MSDTRRVEAFSDGVFAIAITLLVLDLRVPEFESGRLLHDLAHLWGAYIAYVSSFLYIGVIWLNHHNAFTRIHRIDRGLQWANLGLLFTTALLPVPDRRALRALQSGGTGDRRTAVVLYALIAGAMAAAWLGLFHRLSHHPELTGGDDGAAFFGASAAAPGSASAPTALPPRRPDLPRRRAAVLPRAADLLRPHLGRNTMSSRCSPPRPDRLPRPARRDRRLRGVPADRLALAAPAQCTICGHIGCCDDSPNKHATAHYHATEHP